MKKTYKNQLPKNMEVKSTKVRVENGEVFVDVEFKEKFEPKDGDFCVDLFGNIFILCEEGNIGDNHGSYALLRVEGNEWFFQRNNMTRAVRYATPEEKSDFLARLEKECGKRWNAEKKCLEDVYVPKFGDIVKVCIDVEYDGMRDYMICIFPNKPLPTKSDGIFFDIANIGRSGELYYNCGYMRSDKIIHASESEKKELFDRLTRVGKCWNEKTKQLEDIRWRAEKGSVYYYIDERGNILACDDTRGCASDSRYKCGNYFRTIEVARPYADQIKEIFKSSKAE